MVKLFGMTAPTFLTRIDIDPGWILVESEVDDGEALTDEQTGRLRGQLGWRRAGRRAANVPSQAWG